MNGSMGVGTFLIWEGALVLAVVVLRLGCLRVADLELMPVAIRRRVDATTRLTPVAAALSVALVVAGMLL
ncbi:hypothetical protein [Cryptosporangium sp. NPDC051539]|uniref:hypothetical protein n=1 Tax=Cryptosporangium sp. NPDC051539 TaxID=3363962 RepID=UPI00379C761A